jgi:hypothetical protein
LKHHALDFSAVANRHKHCKLKREKELLLLLFSSTSNYILKKAKRVKYKNIGESLLLQKIRIVLSTIKTAFSKYEIFLIYSQAFI